MQLRDFVVLFAPENPQGPVLIKTNGLTGFVAAETSQAGIPNEPEIWQCCFTQVAMPADWSDLQVCRYVADKFLENNPNVRFAGMLLVEKVQRLPAKGKRNEN